MRIQHTFGVACCSAGVTHAGCQVFVCDVELNSRCSLQQLFVVVHLETINRFRHIAFAVIHDDQMLHGRKCWQQRSDQREQRAINKDHFIFSVVHDVRELLWEQPNVQRVRNATCARWREVQLKMARSIPCKCGNATIFRNTQLVQHSTELTRSRCPFAIGGALNPRGCRRGNGLFAVILLGALKQMNHCERCLLHQSLHCIPL